MIIKISGQPVPYRAGSIDVDDAVGQRSTASFVVIDKTGTAFYSQGQQVEIIEGEMWDDGETWGDGGDWTYSRYIYHGIIHEPSTIAFAEGHAGKFHTIQCADNTYIADKRIIAKAYQDMTAGAIVQDIVDNYLASEGVTTSFQGETYIQDGPTVVEAVFNYIPITQALDSLAEKAGFVWWIDLYKRLHFIARDTYVSPVTIDETSKIRGVEVRESNQGYRNKQYIRAGKDTTDPQTISFVWDGVQESFVVGYPIAKEPTISINGTPLAVGDIGIRGLENNKRWYWNKESNVITQEDSLLVQGDTVSITFQGLFDIVVLTYDQAEIDRRGALEGASGIHEDVDDEPHINTRDGAFQNANAKLQKYAKVGRRITFETEIQGIEAGQLLNIDLPTFNTVGQYLVESVRFIETTRADGKSTYQITAVDGPETGGWAKLFKNMATRGQAFVVRENIQENQILITLENFGTDTLTLTESMSYTVHACPVPSVNLYPSSTLYPC